jgi:hypothetical protein
VRGLSLVGPLTVTAELALLSLARTGVRSHTGPAVERGQAAARLAIWWPGERLQGERLLTAGCPWGDETSRAGPRGGW